MHWLSKWNPVNKWKDNNKRIGPLIKITRRDGVICRVNVGWRSRGG